MKRLSIFLGVLFMSMFISACAVYKDKQGQTHYEFLPPATGVYVDPYYYPPPPPPAYYGYGYYYPYYYPYYGYYGYYGRRWR